MGATRTVQKPFEGSPYARHLPALDGVRGFAVLGVACSHIFPGTPHSALQSLVHAAFSFGSRGVDLFFVLSGFLITGILYDSLPDPGFFRKFYARRILRIFPLYYGVLAAYALAALFFGLNFHNPTALPRSLPAELPPRRAAHPRLHRTHRSPAPALLVACH